MIAAETVIVVDPMPLTVGGVNVAVAPAGSPVTLNDTAPVKPFCGVTFTVYPGADPPGTTARVVGVTEIRKSVEEPLPTAGASVTACKETFPVELCWVYVTLSVWL